MSNRLVIARVSWTRTDEFQVSHALRTAFYCSTWNEAFRQSRDYVKANKLGAEECVKIELREALTNEEQT